MKRLHPTIKRETPAMPKKIQFEWELPDTLVDALTHDRTEVAETMKAAVDGRPSCAVH
jgi:hypothetical protein